MQVTGKLSDLIKSHKINKPNTKELIEVLDIDVFIAKHEMDETQQNR